MIITVASFKGGVGKTTTSVHIAAYLQTLAPTLLVDGDPNRSATRWGSRGKLPFKVIDEGLLAKNARYYENIVIDTAARPTKEEMEVLAEGCDLLVIPTTPDVMSLEALGLTIEALERIEASNFKALLTIVPPSPSKDGQEAQAMFRSNGIPTFTGAINRRVAFQKAALQGIIVNEVRKEIFDQKRGESISIKDSSAQSAWKEYLSVGKEITDEQI